ncbi:MAG: NERD domain-containing protein [Methanobacteriaceae archaeon]|nr:NERD domain-containing protein [Methanobacteriaceae archaeon]
MGYLFCQKCGGYYELSEGETLDEFAHCSCGGSLIYTEKIKEQSHPHNTSENLNESKDKKTSIPPPEGINSREFADDLDEKSKNKTKMDYYNLKYHNEKQISKLGLILMFIGLLLLILAFFYPFLLFGTVINNPDNFIGLFVQTIWIYMISIITMILGAFLFLFFNISMSNTKKRSKTSHIRENLKNLPGSYTIFQNIRIPKTRSLIGHMVIGSNGIFIIHHGSNKGNFVILKDEWWRLQGNKRTKSAFNPAKTVKMNVVDLKRFLNTHNVDVDYRLITPIVSFPSRQFTVEEAPEKYNLMPPEEVSEFIINTKRTMDPQLMMRVIALIARHSN